MEAGVLEEEAAVSSVEAVVVEAFHPVRQEGSLAVVEWEMAEEGSAAGAMGEALVVAEAGAEAHLATQTGGLKAARVAEETAGASSVEAAVVEACQSVRQEGSLAEVESGVPMAQGAVGAVGAASSAVAVVVEAFQPVRQEGSLAAVDWEMAEEDSAMGVPEVPEVPVIEAGEGCSVETASIDQARLASECEETLPRPRLQLRCLVSSPRCRSPPRSSTPNQRVRRIR